MIVNPGVNFGSGDVTVNQSILVLGGSNLSTTASLNVGLGSQVIFNSTSTAPTIGSLAGAGSVTLGSGGAAPTLTVGGNNASTVFVGNINQNAAAAAPA